MADSLAFLHALLVRGSAADKAEIKRLLQLHHDRLLRTLESEPSPDQQGGAPKRPAFPAINDSAPKATGADPLRTSVSQLLQIDPKATEDLLDLLKRDSYNTMQALAKSADVDNCTGKAGNSVLAPLEAELALLRYAHEQRCLLLRCVHQLLTTAFNCGAELHAIACGAVALLLQGGLPSRIVALIPSLTSPSEEALQQRLPGRLTRLPDTSTLRHARSEWKREVGALLALQAAKERCEALGLLVLLRYMPVHHTALPESLDPLSDLLTTRSGAVDDDSAPSALYEIIVGKEHTTMTPLLDALAPLLSSSSSEAKAQQLLSPAEGALSQQSWEKRAEQLATLVLMAAMHGEKDFCQLRQPAIARTRLVTQRHEELTSKLLKYGRAAVAQHATPGGSALGALLITWCVVMLEVAPDAQVSELSTQLAIAGEALSGLSWGVDLLRTRGFRHDDPPEELSSIARNLHFDLVAGMLSQQRFRSKEDDSDDAAIRPADTGWPAHSVHLVTLMAAVLEGRPALCHTFWSAAESMAEGSLGSILLYARYPARGAPLTSLLAALCADSESAGHAWRFAHRLRRVCHHLPRNMQLHGIQSIVPNQLRTEVASHSFGSPSIELPAGSIGICIEEATMDNSTMLVEWSLPEDHSLDMGPWLACAVSSLVRAGTGCTESVRDVAAASLSLLVHAPEVHTAAELIQLMPPLADLVELLPLCVALPVRKEEPPLLLLALQLLAALAPIVPQPLAVLLQRKAMLWSETPWLPEQDHARHASMLLQVLHSLAMAAALPTASKSSQVPTLPAAHQLVAVQLLQARDGGELSWQHERKLRALAYLISVLDGFNCTAAQHSIAKSVVSCLLSSGTAHIGLLDALRWACGPLQVELRRRQQWCPSAAFDAADSSTSHTMLLILAATLGLLARILQQAHGEQCALHDALLSPGPTSGVRCLATCILLHAEVADDPVIMGFHSLSPTKCHDVASLEREVIAVAMDSDLEMKTILPLCPVDVPSIGPLAARCLALMCHAAAKAQSLSQLLPQLSPLSASLSCTLKGWLTAVIGDSNGLQSPGEELGHDDPGLDGGSPADCASAALQLLGAAAETSPQLLDALCRGHLHLGEIVRIHDGWMEPDGGWGLVEKGMTGKVRAVEQDTVIIDFATHKSWVTARLTQLELCAPGPDVGRDDTTGIWKTWQHLKPSVEQNSAKSPHMLGMAPDKGEAANTGPLPVMQQLLEMNSKDVGSRNGSRLLQALQLQTLSVMAELWRRPAEHANALCILRGRKAFWDTLGRMLQAPQFVTNGDLATNPENGRGQNWLSLALAVSIVTREIATAVPPSCLALSASNVIADILRWLAAPKEDNSIACGSDVLSNLMVCGPTLAQTSLKLKEEARRLAAELLGGADLNGQSAPNLSMVPSVPVACARLHASVALFKANDSESPPVMHELWAGGRERLLPWTPLFDVEALLVRAWKVLEGQLRTAESMQGGYATVSASNTFGGAAVRALEDAAERAMTSDMQAVAETAMILDELPNHLSGPGTAANSVSGSMLGQRKHLSQLDTLARAAAHADTASLVEGAHAALVRSWRQLLSMLHQRAPIARPPSPAVVDGTITAAWLSGVSETNTLETLMHTRVRELARQHTEWGERCASIRQLRHDADGLDAAAELLTQQQLAMCSTRALAWQLVDMLMTRRSWQTRVVQQEAQREAHTAASFSTEHNNAPLDGANHAAIHKTKLMVLKAALDDGSQLRRSDAGEGWQLLHKLSAQVCGRLEALLAKPGGRSLRSPPAQNTITQAISAIQQANSQLVQLVTASTCRTTSEETQIRYILDQLATLSRQVRHEASLFGSNDALASAEKQARITCQMLDCNASVKGVDRRVPASSTESSVTELIELAKAASMPSGEGSEPVRHELMSSALSKLSWSRESMHQQAKMARALAVEQEDDAVSSQSRVSLLHALDSSSHTVSTPWSSAEKVHASLIAELQHVQSQRAHAEQCLCVKGSKVAKTLITEQFDECIALLADCQHQRSATAQSTLRHSELLKRIDCCHKLLDVLCCQENEDDAASQRSQSEASLLAAITALESSKETAKTHASRNGARSNISRAVQLLIACEEGHQAAMKGRLKPAEDDAVAGLESRASHVHEIMCVLALALHHETSVAQPASAPRAASTMLVRMTPGPPSARCFLTSFGGETTLRRMDPHGWCSDAYGRVIEQIPAQLCAVLWPFSAVDTNEPTSPNARAVWHAELSRATQRLTVALSDKLSSRSQAEGHLSGCGDAASLLLSSLCAQLLSTQTRRSSYLAFDCASNLHILKQVVSVMLVAPSARAPAFSSSILACMLLLLNRVADNDSDLLEQLELLASKLVIESPVDSPLHAHETALSVCILANILIRWSRVNTVGAATLRSAAIRIMDVALHDGAPTATLCLLLPSLLKVVESSALAEALLESGLLTRLIVAFSDFGVVRSSDASVAFACKQREGEAWCTTLAIAATALRQADPSTAAHSFAQVSNIVPRMEQRLRAAITGGNTLDSARAQRMALLFVEAVAHLRGAYFESLNVLPLLCPTIMTVATTIMLAPAELQRAMMPVSPEDRKLANCLPSGDLIPRFGRRTVAAGRTPPCGTAFSATLLATLRSSLSSLISILSEPQVLQTHPHTQELEEALLCGLRGVLHLIKTSHGAYDGRALGCVSESHDLLLANAQGCVRIYTRIIRKAAAKELQQLTKALALASAHRGANQTDGAISDVRRSISSHVNELRRLPNALQLWVEAAMDDLEMVDAMLRKKILQPLMEEVEHAVSKDLAEAQILAGL